MRVLTLEELVEVTGGTGGCRPKKIKVKKCKSNVKSGSGSGKCTSKSGSGSGKKSGCVAAVPV